MREAVALRFEKARKCLAEAKGMDPDAKPMGTVTLAHYSMFHAASAVLVVRTGDAPVKHGSVIGEFGRIVKDLDERHRDAGRAINMAFDIRLDANDAIGKDLDGEVATETIEDAVEVLAICEELVRAE